MLELLKFLRLPCLIFVQIELISNNISNCFVNQLTDPARLSLARKVQGGGAKKLALLSRLQIADNELSPPNIRMHKFLERSDTSNELHHSDIKILAHNSGARMLLDLAMDFACEIAAPLLIGEERRGGRPSPFEITVS